MAAVKGWALLRPFNKILGAPKVVAFREKAAGWKPVRFFIGVLEDYQTVVKETILDMKNRPLRALFYSSILSVGLVANRMTPSELSYRDVCVEDTNELIQVPSLSRKPEAEEYLKQVFRLRNQNRLEYYHLGVCSVVLRREHSDKCDLYEARCKYLKPSIWMLPERFVDVGVFGHWILLERAMQDFDVPE